MIKAILRFQLSWHEIQVFFLKAGACDVYRDGKRRQQTESRSCVNSKHVIYKIILNTVLQSKQAY